MLRWRCILALLLYPFFADASTTVVFQPDSACGKDAIIASFWPDATHGSFADFIACAWTYQGNPSTTRALITFDFASLPSNATIISASLDLYYYPSSYNTGHSNLSGPASCWLQRITQPWSEMTVTWNNQPSTTSLNQVNVPAPTSMTQNYTIDVTQLVQDIMNNSSSSFGFELRQQNESYYRSLLFATSDMSNPALHPKLTVTYTIDQLPAAGCWDTAYIGTTTTPPPPPVTVIPDPLISLPNVFTPNGDGINDTFFADTSYVFINEFDVYDRWGIMVFESLPGEPWDGTSPNGKNCSDGTYYYILRYSDFAGKQGMLKGFVTLIR